MKQKVYYITNDDFNRIQIGYLITTFEKDGITWATIRENVDKYRPEHFHDIPLWNVKEYKENNEIGFLNNIINDLCDRLSDLWDNLKDIIVSEKTNKEM